MARTGVDHSFLMSQKRLVCYSVRAVLGRLQAVGEEDWRVCRFVGETVAMEEGQPVKEGSMLGECCAARTATTEGTDIDVEIDQCLTVPPSNYDL